MTTTLEPRHRSKLAELLQATVEFSRAEIEVALELVDAALSDPSSGYDFVLSEAGADVLGYACFGPTPMTEGCFDVYWLVVAPFARRRGVGRALLSAVNRAARAAGARLLRIETSGKASHAPARSLYERAGFREAARLADFYARGDDLCVYTKYLG